ncbi:hypothetical protein H0H93_002760 [Arthromyces matolae]|nr:hypothetical protein H0H93_002760 [Arthromyces matolae]
MSIPCPQCPRTFRSSGGLTQHINALHREISQPPDDDNSICDDDEKFTYIRDSHLTGKVLCDPCDANGYYLPPKTPPPPSVHAQPGNWDPFRDRTAFDFAFFHFVKAQSSKSEILEALDLWLASVTPYGGDIPWTTAQEMYTTIDAIEHGLSTWKTVKIRYQGPIPEHNPPQWMTQTYELCTQNARSLLHHQMSKTEFKDSFNPAPYMQFNKNGERIFSNLFSGDWVQKQSRMISKLPNTHGAMFLPVVLGSDKTTVSVATGHQQYHPVYMSPGVLTNIARRSQGSAVLPVAFLPIPKGVLSIACEFQNDSLPPVVNDVEAKTSLFKQFARQLYHACLTYILDPLKPGMTVPEVIKCPDGHFRRAIYGIGPYIADYPEQVWLTGIVQDWCPKCDARPDFLDDPNARQRSHEKTEFLMSCFDPGILWSDYGIRCDVRPFTSTFPRADIHELLSPDLLHQIIKGTFKDHLVEWVGIYLRETHGDGRAKEVMKDIDRRISAVPAFPGLRRFYDGRNFTQWTGDDSKALMKVYLAAISGHVPSQMVQCFSAFLDFCYIVRKNSLTPSNLQHLEIMLTRFHQLRQIFIDVGVRETISLPRQHAMVHYPRSIRLFGSPNGLCSSITESKHIKAVKEPWRRSSRYKALNQMLCTLGRMEKLSTARTIFTSCGMMVGSTSSYASFIRDGGVPAKEDSSDEEDEGADETGLGPSQGPRVMSSVKLAATREPGYPRDLTELANHIHEPRLVEAVLRFLHAQVYPDASPENVDLDSCPRPSGHISVFHSALARFYSPSDTCGAGGMCRERIRSHPNWRGLYPRHDTVLVETDATQPGVLGMTVARVLLFFSFNFEGQGYQCALVNWLVRESDVPDSETGLWLVKPEWEARGRRTVEVVHIDSIARGVHLLPVFGSTPLPEGFHFSQALDSFRAYFINCYADHHAHEFII